MGSLRSCLLASLLVLGSGASTAQDQGGDAPRRVLLESGVEYRVEAQATSSHGSTPLWLNANRYGLSSLEGTNAYLRASVIRPLAADSARRWGIGYGVDLAVPYHFTSHFVVQQAFAEFRWLHGALSIGSMERPMELKNNSLSSGSQTLGINARPVPQVRLGLPDYWVLPFGHGWLRLKGHIAYGRMTDDSWQHEFTDRQSKYADDVLYHSKAIYLKIGNEDRFYPFSLVLGLESACTFGGTSYIPDGEGGMTAVRGKRNIGAYFNALFFSGVDSGEDTYRNAQGNQLGSWLVRLGWDYDDWSLGVYLDKYFEDHSGMLGMDYDGYGEGEDWQEREHTHYVLYAFKDMMLGAELNLRRPRWINDIVFEYLYTKYQSGPVYHDHTSTVSDHVGGKDNYYNHYLYTGWQHWGQVIGNPLYRSPIYNTDGTIEVLDSRFMALHLGIGGHPARGFSYRLMLTYQEGLGTYDAPYPKAKHNVSGLLEGRYAFWFKPMVGWSLGLGLGLDHGGILGNNLGAQLTVAKSGLLSNDRSKRNR